MSICLSTSKHIPKARTLWFLSALHIGIIAASNYLVQLPVDVFGFHTTWGAFSFPLVYITTDLTVRIYGSSPARRIIAAAMIPALLVSYLISIIFSQGSFQGLSALCEFNLFVARIALASFCAYLAGQLLDISVFNRLRQRKSWWIAPTASSLFGNSLDSLVFFSIAFYKSQDVFMANNWVEIALVDYCFKLLISVLFMLPLYRILLGYLTCLIYKPSAQ